jgi:hypothetical protein
VKQPNDNDLLQEKLITTSGAKAVNSEKEKSNLTDSREKHILA